MASYLVTGATGQQGGAVVTHLLAAGANVHAVVRDQSSPKATALRDRGVVLFEGTHEEPDTVFRAAAAGCTGVFLNPSVFQPGQAKAQADAIIRACKAGARQTLTSIVLSSTSRTEEMSADLAVPTAVHPWLGQYFTAKVEVEAAVRESGLRYYAILRPPVLAYDYLLPSSANPQGFPDLPRSGTLVTSLNDDVSMPLLDPDDVGRFAAAALLDPAKFSGHEIVLASDNLSPREVRDVLARVSGINIKFHKRTPAEMEETRMIPMFHAFELLANHRPRRVDVKALEEKYGFELTRFAEYMQRNKDELINSLPPRSAAALWGNRTLHSLLAANGWCMGGISRVTHVMVRGEWHWQRCLSFCWPTWPQSRDNFEMISSNSLSLSSLIAVWVYHVLRTKCSWDSCFC